MGKHLRNVLLWLALGLGTIEFLGACFWMCAGAGMYGSPLRGGSEWTRNVIGFLVTCPLAMLPAAVLAIWRPRFAGLGLMVAAVMSAWFAVLVMWPPDHEWSENSNISQAQYAFQWSLALILPLSLPSFLIGCCLACRRRTNASG